MQDCPKSKATKACTATTATSESKSDSTDSKKIVSDPCEQATQADGCIDLDHVAQFVRLNASALSDPDSLYVDLTIPSFSLSLRTLLDSGSSHCFMDKQFIANHNIPTIMVPPIGLHLFDGTCNSVISQAVEIPIHFPTGIMLVIKFFVTSLDSSCSAVLGYNWLKNQMVTS